MFGKSQNLNKEKTKTIELVPLHSQETFSKEYYMESLLYLEEIIEKEPKNCEAYKLIGDIYAYFLPDIGKAIYYYEKHFKLDPKNYDIYRKIGDIYVYDRPEEDKAIYYYEKYIKYAPENALVYNMLGHLYSKICKYEETDKQIKYFEKAVELDPELKEAYKNLMVVYPRAGREQDAIRCFHKLLELGASMDDCFNYACLNIKLRNFEEGWKYYEKRFLKETDPTIYPEIVGPDWKGQDISNKTLLVQYEQGFGDSIQFSRYLSVLKKFNAKLIFRVQDELVELFKTSLDGIEVVKMSTPLEELSYDYHVAHMSLIHILNSRVEDIPLSNGYIKADERKIKAYKEKYFDNDCFKIGLAWHGNVKGEHNKNIPLDFFYSLTQLKNVKVYSFQKGMGSEELEYLPAGIEIIDLGKNFNDFSDTAAAMANVDLAISSDNVIFHLAAAMGKKSFLLLGRDSEYRWFYDEDTTPWYDSAKIFKKQKENDSWELSIQRVIDNIEKAINIGKV